MSLQDEIIKACVELSFPKEFGYTIARELTGEWGQERMLAYLRSARPTSAEDIADELLVILDDIQKFKLKAQLEHANMTYNAYLNRDA